MFNYGKYVFCIYRSLTKEYPWADHLASLPKRGVGALLCVLHLTTKECPRLCAFSDSLPEKFAEVLDNSSIQQSHQPWKLTFWHHKTLWMVKYHREHGVASLCGPISQLQCKVTLSSVTQSFPTSYQQQANTLPKATVVILYVNRMHVWGNQKSADLVRVSMSGPFWHMLFFLSLAISKCAKMICPLV